MKATKILIGALILSSLLMIVPCGTIRYANADAPSEIYSDAYKDGYILAIDPAYPPAASDVFSSGMSILVGQEYNGFDYHVYRGFLSFDTSVIPDNAIIQTAILQIYWNAIFGSPPIERPYFGVDVYDSDYGVSLDLSDWTIVQTYQGRIIDDAFLDTHGLKTLGLLPTSVNKTGMSDFILKSSLDGWTEPPTQAEFIGFSSADLGYELWEPAITVTYETYGSIVTLTMASGVNHALTVYPSIEPWNLTYNRWSFEVDTVPDTANLTIDMGVDWEYLGSFPFANLTFNPTNLTLEDVADSVTYRIWFAVPMTDPKSEVHVAYYDAFTGEGFAWEILRLSICNGTTWDDNTAEVLPGPDFEVSIYGNFVIRVTDYFNNSLTDYSFSANTARVFVNIPVPVYSWEVVNMNDAPALMRIYWNNSGAPFEFFVAPHWVMERFLKGGAYTFMVTFYDSDGTAGETVSYNRTVPMTGLNASFVYISGYTLYEIISSVQGVMAKQEIITALISPSMVLVYENLPVAPARIRSLSLLGGVAIDPYLVLEATTFQNGTGTNVTIGCPHPQNLASSYTIMTDVLTFAGPYEAQVMVNSSDSTVVHFSSATLPASAILSGATNITVWSNQTITTSRATSWREVSEYTVTYYATEKRYQTVLAFNNSMNVSYYAPYWYVSFPSNTAIDPDSVVVWDLDNGIALSIRTNYEVSSGGIHMTLPILNASDVRNFRITYWDLNGTTPIGAPNLIAYAYTTKSLGDKEMKYVGIQWVNPSASAYQGEIFISFNFTYGDSLSPSSITVIDETNGITLSSSQWIYTGRTIWILSDGVGTVGIGEGRNYGVYFTIITDAVPKERHDFFFDSIEIGGQSWYIGGVAVSIFLIGIVFAWGIVAYSYWRGKTKGDWSLVIIVLCLTVVGFYLRSMMLG